MISSNRPRTILIPQKAKRNAYDKYGMDGLDGNFDETNGDSYIFSIIWKLLQILFYIYMILFFILFMVEFNVLIEIRKIIISVKEHVLSYFNAIITYFIGLYINFRCPTITYTWPEGVKPT